LDQMAVLVSVMHFDPLRKMFWNLLWVRMPFIFNQTRRRTCATPSIGMDFVQDLPPPQFHAPPAAAVPLSSRCRWVGELPAAPVHCPAPPSLKFSVRMGPGWRTVEMVCSDIFGSCIDINLIPNRRKLSSKIRTQISTSVLRTQTSVQTVRVPTWWDLVMFAFVTAGIRWIQQGNSALILTSVRSTASCAAEDNVSTSPGHSRYFLNYIAYFGRSRDWTVQRRSNIRPFCYVLYLKVFGLLCSIVVNGSTDPGILKTPNLLSWIQMLK
jgi:hypothetical protein